jgi:hypothetical protein
MGVVGIPHALAVVRPDAGAAKSAIVLPVRDPATEEAAIGFEAYAWSPDGRVIYFVGRDPRDQAVGVYRLPAAGGVPQLAVRFDDPTHRWHRTTGLRVRGARFYLNLGDQQGDLWMVELAESR